MTRKLYEIATDIVESQASFKDMSPDSLELPCQPFLSLCNG